MFAESDGRSRFVWIADVLPNEIAPYMDAQMDLGAAGHAEGIGTQRGMTSAFLDALGADGPRPTAPARWISTAASSAPGISMSGNFPKTARERRRAGEWHFGWALEGRAIQDVWIVPPRGELRHGDAAANVNSYGTTLRVYDPDIDAWRIQWTDPVTRNFLQMIGRAEGATSCSSGTRPDGQLVRWSFREITARFVPLARRSLGGCRAQPGASSPSSPPAAGTRDLSHRSASRPLLASPHASEWRRVRGGERMRSRTMTGADKVVCQAATLLCCLP